MTRYETLKHKPKRFLSLTGYTLEEFSALVPYFSKRFLASVETKTLQGKHRKKRRYTQYKNSCLPSLEDKLLFILIYLRKAMTQDVLGELFGTSQPVANKLGRFACKLACSIVIATRFPVASKSI